MFSKNSTKNVHNFHQLANIYDGFLCDLWGVVYEGDDIFENAVFCLQQIKKLNKLLIFLTNSPRDNAGCANHLNLMGISPDLYFKVYTAGQSAMDFLKENQTLLGNIPYLIDINFWEGWNDLHSSYSTTNDINKANFILALAIPKNIDDIKYYDNLLHQALSLNLPLINANNDFFVMQKGTKYLRPGIFAKRYKEMGGITYNFGKPDPRVFAAALQNFSVNQKILMIGDTEQTDIIGAKKVGIDTLF